MRRLIIGLLWLIFVLCSALSGLAETFEQYLNARPTAGASDLTDKMLVNQGGKVKLAPIKPTFSKWSSAGMSVVPGLDGTMQVMGATFSKPGGKPTLTLDTNGQTITPADIITTGPAVDVRAGTLATTVALATTKNRALHITQQISITSDTDLSAVPEVDIIQGGSFNIAAGVTLTLPANFHAGLVQCFYGTGSVVGILVAEPEWWGARADGLDSSAAANTAAIMAAVHTRAKVTLSTGEYVHNGLAFTTSDTPLDMVGRGKHLTTLTCKSAGVHNISLTATTTFFEHVHLADFAIKGNDLNGCGIYNNGVVWFVFERLYIWNNGSHGIQLDNNYTPSHGSFIGTIKDCLMYSNVGDGIYQVGTANGGSNMNQQNATYYVHNEMHFNANGITMWGVNLVARENVIEGNSGYGIQIQNFKSGAPAYGAIALDVADNYFEANALGHIYAKTQGISSGTIQGLTITGSYGYTDAPNDPSHPAVKFVSAGDQRELRELRYEKNQFSNQSGLATIDFGNVPGFDSVIVPGNALLTSSTVSAFQTAATVSNFINTGMARVEFIKSSTIQGFWMSKGGANITWSNMLKSDNITVSGAYSYFPLSLPLQAAIAKVIIPVETDSTAWSVDIKVQYKSNLNNSAYTNLFDAPYPSTGTASGSGVAETFSTPYYVGWTNNRRTLDNGDMILKITVTINSPGTFFYIGNPTLFYN